MTNSMDKTETDSDNCDCEKDTFFFFFRNKIQNVCKYLENIQLPAELLTRRDVAVSHSLLFSQPALCPIFGTNNPVN